MATFTVHQCDLCGANNHALLKGFGYDSRRNKIRTDSLEDANLHLCGKCLNQIQEHESEDNDEQLCDKIEAAALNCQKMIHGFLKNTDYGNIFAYVDGIDPFRKAVQKAFDAK